MHKILSEALLTWGEKRFIGELTVELKKISIKITTGVSGFISFKRMNFGVRKISNSVEASS